MSGMSYREHHVELRILILSYTYVLDSDGSMCNDRFQVPAVLQQSVTVSKLELSLSLIMR